MNDKQTSHRPVNLVLGITLSAVGLIFLLNNLFHYLSLGRLWPLFLLIPAVLFTLIWVKDRDRYYVFLFPITLLVFFSIYFLVLNFTSWYWVELTWPNFLIGPGLGFLVLYLPKKEWGFLLPALILFILAAIFYSELLADATLAASVIFIGLGLFFIFRSRLISRSGPEKGSPAEKKEE
jgi:hypothetical protein